MGTTEYLAAYVSPLPDPDAAATAAPTSSQPAPAGANVPAHLAAQPTTSAKARAKRSGRRHHLPTKVERAQSKARCRMHAPSALKQD